MRPLTALLGSLTIPLLLSACSDDQSLATAPASAGLTTTGTFKCRFHKYTASLTVTDEGVITS